MSSGDYLRFLRALHGGKDFFSIEEETGIPSGLMRQIEQRYRAVGDEATLRKLAEYYGVPPEEVLWRHEWSRARLTFALEDAMRDDVPIRLNLRTGESFTGKVQWVDLAATCLKVGDREIIVQRHWVDTWELLRPEGESSSEEDASPPSSAPGEEGA